jgi:hypothetical protein
MPSERIGDCGGAQYPDKEWITAELDLGISYIRHACGEPPPGYQLDIVWHEHEVGEYAEIAITWDGFGDAPWDYIRRAENALSRFDDAVAWSELAPEPDEEPDDEDDLNEGEGVPDDGADPVDNNPPSAVQQTLFVADDEPRHSIELYRRDEMIEADQKDWHMTLLIFQEMGWRPERPLEAYAHSRAFIKHDEGEAMQRAGRSLFAAIQQEPSVSASVRMDLGLFYRLTEFVGVGAFIVGRPGSYEDAKENDFSG